MKLGRISAVYVKVLPHFNEPMKKQRSVCFFDASAMCLKAQAALCAQNVDF